ncbi:extracellular solute-binding protein [Microbacterium terricola]|uniref:Membrane protein n=1 Tax=Microbacterium terricola TaxID=344163 RepID=A0ABM8E122_9MICO|nr:extracellular solute-binding protein [Microbacterium terricola]UYK40811.1 extracellular solute-binding protein [Microbacterium terricola]BDV31441.1 membrane protein [Microbacterium terricola]
MASFVGLTWDHPRGRAALEAGAPILAADGDELRWDVHSLEGFESAPLEDLADRYDLIVLDHPHLGDALSSGCLRAMEDVMGETFVDDVARRAVGPSLESYRLGGRTWALPLDAATQVSARRADLADVEPTGWDDVLELARSATVALSLSGPHAYLTFASVCQSLGAPLATGAAERIVDPDVGATAFGILAELAGLVPAHSETQNPIDLLERMVGTDDIAYIPLVYGYVGYADRERATPVVYGPSPVGPDGRSGSTIGGTGIAVTRRCDPTTELRRHLAWLLSDDAQAGFIPAHQGQPAMRAGWESRAVNAPVGDFYLRTRSTIESAWIRPRFEGFTAVQALLSETLRTALIDRTRAADVLARLDRIHHDATGRLVNEGIAS